MSRSRAWTGAEWRKGGREIERVPAHEPCVKAEPFMLSNARLAARLRRKARHFGKWPNVRVGVWSLRQIAKQIGTTETRVRELLRARPEVTP